MAIDEMPPPVLVETLGSVTVRWFCTPPLFHSPYVVTRCYWFDNDTRDIYAWEPAKLSLSMIDCGDCRLRIVAEEL